jgi:hypothetical protein
MFSTGIRGLVAQLIGNASFTGYKIVRIKKAKVANLETLNIHKFIVCVQLIFRFLMSV